MALAYLLDPSFQTLDENGRPLVGGHIEVYYHNTSTKYVTKADFEGTDNPFKVPLNSKGMAVIIASDQFAYDVFCYDRFGALYWSRQNVTTIGGSGGGGGGSSVPLVRVAFRNGAWSKISGDDGFIKPNPWGVDSLFLPESCWWLFNVTLSLRNPTPRDLIQQIQLAWEWNGYISMDVPPATYEAVLPAMQFDYDFTGQFTRQTSRSMLYEKDNRTNDWLSVAVQAYQDTLPNDLESVVGIDIFKVRDA